MDSRIHSSTTVQPTERSKNSHGRSHSQPGLNGQTETVVPYGIKYRSTS